MKTRKFIPELSEDAKNLKKKLNDLELIVYAIDYFFQSRKVYMEKQYKIMNAIANS